MSPKVLIDGRLVDQVDARIRVLDHGLLYGDGVSESLRAFSGRVLRLAEHVERLFASARAIRLAIPLTQAELTGTIEETLTTNRLADAYIRVLVTRGAGSLDLDPRKTTDPRVVIIAEQVSPYPPELQEYGLKVAIAAIRRPDPAAFDPRIRSLIDQVNVLAKLEARSAGSLDALMLDHRGELVGSTAGNLFLVREGTTNTLAVEAGVMDGIARRAVREQFAGASAGCVVVCRGHMHASTGGWNGGLGPASARSTHAPEPAEAVVHAGLRAPRSRLASSRCPFVSFRPPGLARISWPSPRPARPRRAG